VKPSSTSSIPASFQCTFINSVIVMRWTSSSLNSANPVPEASALEPLTALSRANPFPGLRPYGEEDANWFFGRSGEINDLLKRLRRLHFVAVVGTSGSGKSSLVRAGVLPQIRDGYLDVRWQVAAFRPGERPIANLAESIAPIIAGESGDGSALRSGPAGMVRALQAAHMPVDTKLLILLDQFEELFQFAHRTGDAAQEEIKEFLKLLLTAASSDDVAVYVVITMRVEWMNECAMYPGLAEAINQGIYLVPQLSRRQFQEAILGPLEAAAGSITSALLDRMLNDLDNKSDQLPVLQHALMRLWQRNVLPQAPGGARGLLDIAGYEAVGTFTNCLSAHAEEVFAEFSKRQQQVAEILFRNITQINRNRKVRRPRPVADILQMTGSFEELKAVIVAFSRTGRSFLVTTQGPLSPDSIVDITHEALIRQWARLSNWVEDEAEIQTRLRRLEEDAEEWDRDRAHSHSSLYTGARLLRAEELRRHLKPGSTTAEFLHESSRARFWSLVWRRGWIVLTALLLIGAAIGVAYVNSERAKASRALATLAETQRQQAEETAERASSQAKKAQEFQANIVQQIDAAKGNANALAQIAQNIQAKRVYLQYVPAEAQLARSLQGQLQQRGFVVPGTEKVSSDRAPSGTQVRFFHPEDRADATRLANVLRPLVTGGISVQASANPDQVVPQGQFEVWLVPPPPAETPHPPPVKAAGAKQAGADTGLVPTLSASLSQDRIDQGRGVTLTWGSEGATAVEIEGIGRVQPNGTMVMTPEKTTTYKLIARGSGGDTTKSVSVEVTPATNPNSVVAPNRDVASETNTGRGGAPPDAMHNLESPLSGVQQALTNYKKAYESESLDEMRRAWPAISKAQQKNMSTVFNQFNAIHLDLVCPNGDIHIETDSATANCRETAVYTIKGNRQPPQSTSTTFRLRKQGETWVVDSVH
jgi:hypothetical protein